MRKTTLVTALHLMLCVAMPSIAATRYDHSAHTQPPPETIIDPINAYVRTSYPADVKTVKAAVTWLLEDTNWTIQQAAGFVPPDAQTILAQNIDPIAQLPRTMSRLDAIQILIGANNAILVDHAHRLISFTAIGTAQ